MEENGAAVLRAPIRPLAVLGRWIVVLPEDVQQRVIRHLRGIELHFYHLGMSRLVCADFFIRRILSVAAGIAHGRCHHAGSLTKSGFHTPKTSGAESGLFNLR